MSRKGETPLHKWTVIVRYDCGFGNHLTLRGQGGGLSWHQGVSLKNVGASEWVFEVVTSDDALEFKVLINDQVYEIGDNHHMLPGQVLHVTPKFF